MPGDAFTAGVKLGGLTSGAEIRILLCYLIRTAGPVQRDTLEDALMEEELVNYFELCAALTALPEQGLAVYSPEAGGYSITPKGAEVADALGNDLPRTVRESAARAVMRLQGWQRKAAQHKAEVQATPEGFVVDCSIADVGGEMMRLRLAMPDRLTAETARKGFIENGSEVYRLLLTCLTDEAQEE